MIHSATVKRQTRETDISIGVSFGDPVERNIDTPLPFLNHMLDTFACHAGFGLQLKAKGDIHVDPHHLIEDCGIVLGQAIAIALTDEKKEGGSFAGIQRAGFFSFPMDGSLADVAIDLCGRPNFIWNVLLAGQSLGNLDGRLFREFYKGLTDGLRCTLHINLRYADNDHHAVEAIFKAAARALAQAVMPARSSEALSTKGSLDG